MDQEPTTSEAQLAREHVIRRKARGTLRLGGEYDTHMGQEFVKISKVPTSGKLTSQKKFSVKVKDYVASLRSLITS